MASRQQRKMALRRKLHILRTLTSSKSARKKSIVMDAFPYIYILKLQLEALKKELSDLTKIRREYLTLLIKKQLIQLPKKQVKVEKAGKGFIVRVFCEKGEDHKLVRILEAFEEMGLVPMQARVSCTFYFAMEAIVVAAQETEENQQCPLSGVAANTIARAILKAIDKQGVEMENTKVEI